MKNNVIILAGGQGKRMKSDGPKVLCRVQGRAMLDWVITACENAGIEDICVVKGHKAEMIDEFLAARQSRADIKTVLQTERLGTGHAVQMAKDFLEAHRGGNTLILCGDAPFIDPPTIEGALELHTREQNSVTVVTSEKDDPTGYGRIIRTEGGISGIVEQKDCTPEQAAVKEINSGCYWFNTADLLDVLFELTPNNAQGEYYLTDCLGLLISKGRRANAYRSENPNVSLGANDPAGLQYLNELAEKL